VPRLIARDYPVRGLPISGDPDRRPPPPDGAGPMVSVVRATWEGAWVMLAPPATPDAGAAATWWLVAPEGAPDSVLDDLAPRLAEALPDDLQVGEPGPVPAGLIPTRAILGTGVWPTEGADARVQVRFRTTPTHATAAHLRALLLHATAGEMVRRGLDHASTSTFLEQAIDTAIARDLGLFSPGRGPLYDAAATHVERPWTILSEAERIELVRTALELAGIDGPPDEAVLQVPLDLAASLGLEVHRE
jgi:hypothetical protein